MFRIVPLSIIRSFSLYTQPWYMSCKQQAVSKHVEFHSKNIFEKLVHLVGFIIRIYHDTRSPENQILIQSVLLPDAVKGYKLW